METFDSTLNKIYQGDCIDLLSQVPDGAVDMVFADPPFNLNKKYTSTNDQLTDAAYMAWTERWVRESVRVLKPGGSILVHNIPKWLVQCVTVLNKEADFKHWISWDAPTAPMGKSFQPAHYGILFYTKPGDHKFYELRYPHKRCRKKKGCNHLLKDYGGKKDTVHPFGPLVSDVWTDIHRIKHKKFRDDHPCQLPVHLLERLILGCTDEGDVVLDPFMGTGTTAIAAKRLGRQYVGFEIDDGYQQIATTKLEEETFRSLLGNTWVSFYRGAVASMRSEDWTKVEEYFDVPTARKEIDFKTASLKRELKKQLMAAAK
jgi:site-specific DNA-methyltransferase (adenine-specific)